MKEHCSSTDGDEQGVVVHKKNTVSIICSGTSFENTDLSKLDETVSITVNEMMGFYESDYVFITSYESMVKLFPKVMTTDRRVIITYEHVLKELGRGTLYDYRTGRDLLEKVEMTPNWVIIEGTGTTVVDAIDMASELQIPGAEEPIRTIELYGVDYCSPINKHYAYGIKREIHYNGESSGDGLYSTVKWDKDRRAVEDMVSRWQGVEIVNMSKISKLKCFKKGVLEDGL